MATRWYWRDAEGVNGPISFQELAAMIRDRALNEDDLVRPHYSKEWQTADSVVGLYYMAHRVPTIRDLPVDTADEPVVPSSKEVLSKFSPALSLEEASRTHFGTSSRDCGESAENGQHDNSELRANFLIETGESGAEGDPLATHSSSFSI
ncbi:MAG: hypothetical protein JWP89_6175 [Schlesneria sp.]|nr:hypothetical protein [Schlesneria sp.]